MVSRWRLLEWSMAVNVRERGGRGTGGTSPPDALLRGRLQQGELVEAGSPELQRTARPSMAGGAGG
eukprot:363801-Chlamydomonas_euryale.AAC.20